MMNMNAINWDVEKTIQNRFLNRKPSPKNSYTAVARYAGYTYEELINELEAEKARVGSLCGKLISYKVIRSV